MTTTAEILQKARDEWQPIETAPKDGTKILLYTAYEQNDGAFYGCDPFEAVQIGQWDNGNDLHELDDFYRPAQWDVPLIGEPTHWMPLPEPPAIKRAISAEEAA